MTNITYFTLEILLSNDLQDLTEGNKKLTQRICYKYYHSGYVDVESQLGEGSTFCLKFPRVEITEELDTV